MNYVYDEYDHLRPELYQEWLKEVKEGRGLDLSNEDKHKQNGHLLNSYTGIALIEEDYSTIQVSKWVNGKLHCTDGPALVFYEGTVLYYINHIQYEPEKFYEHPLAMRRKLEKILEL